jgi:hypothetical protein
MLARMSSLIEPVYQTRKANAPIVLARCPLTITFANRTVRSRGAIHLRLEPKPRLVFRANLNAHPHDAFRLAAHSGNVHVEFRSQAAIECFAISVRVHLDSKSASFAEFVPIREPINLTVIPRARLSCVVFHLMNFPAFFSSGPKSQDVLYEAGANASERLGRAILEDDTWRVELQTLPHAKALISQMRNGGGFAITHVGRISRKDGRSFSRASADAFLSELHFFFSFARGSWVPLVLAVGFDKNGSRVFEQWGNRLGTPWNARLSWFDEHQGQSLGDVFGGFVKLLRDGEMGGAARAALYWYLTSNRPGDGVGVDGGVILSQAALDRLATAHASTQHRTVVPDNAANRLREFCAALDLPTVISKENTALFAGRRNRNWLDMPDAIVRVRNELVHPKRRIKRKLVNVTPEAWSVAQRYVELSILRLAGYSGVSSNRLRARWRGEVERVPWS